MADSVPSLSSMKRILDEEDIEGLLALGSPSDEYDAESRLIEGALSKLDNWESREIAAKRIEACIEEIWQRQFGPFDEPEASKRRPHIKKVAQKIVDRTIASVEG
jgi:hypothetical protein